MAEIEAAIEEKKKHEIKRTIYSDSTLRLSDKIGLLAEVITMSGGTIGEIGNAVRDDKQTNGLGAEKSEVIVIAGKNNLKQIDGTRDLAKAAYAIDKGIEKIVSELDDTQQVNFVNVIPQPETITPLQNIISDYMEMSLNNVSESNTQVNVTHVNGENIDMDGTGHPTEEGTVQLLKALSQVFPDLILNEKLCTGKQYYRGVESIYKYGCQICNQNGDFTKHKGFCDSCQEEYEKKDLGEVTEKLKQLYESYFPPANSPDPTESGSRQQSDAVVLTPTKRVHSDSEDEKDANKKLHTINDNDDNDTSSDSIETLVNDDDRIQTHEDPKMET